MTWNVWYEPVEDECVIVPINLSTGFGGRNQPDRASTELMGNVVRLRLPTRKSFVFSIR
jgi:hypothetical protein